MSTEARMKSLRYWQGRGALQALDIELGRLLLELDAEADPALGLATAAASRALAHGHSCLELGRLAEVLEADAERDDCPEPAALRAVLEASPLVGKGSDDERLPLVLDGADRLYLRRYHRYEQQVAAALRARRHSLSPPAETLRALLARHGLAADSAAPDWQAIAVLAGLRSRLTVITGGPGTGKTTTVLWLLEALVEQALAAGRDAPRIALAAPTGKAAARVAESLRAGRDKLSCDAAVRAAIPEDAATLHRLLGTIPGSSRYRHHADKPLDVDVLVVDEASMIDLPLMARLLDALPPAASLVLLGDRNQLASVEAGSVLAALCAAAGEHAVGRDFAARVQAVTGVELPSSDRPAPFADHVVELKRNWRFDATSGLDALARAVLAGDADTVITGLREQRFSGIDWQQQADPARATVQALGQHFAELARADDAAAALRQANRHGVLTALRVGAHGSDTVNEAVDRQLRPHAPAGAGRDFYHGRLLLIRHNDYDTELFNGDIGIVWPDAEGRLVACFPHSDGVRQLPLARLPAHASAWAMTIHKSQGSEYHQARIILPPTPARVLGRELLYTAITRARQGVTLVANETILRHTIQHSTRRASGLADMLQARP